MFQIAETLNEYTHFWLNQAKFYADFSISDEKSNTQKIQSFLDTQTTTNNLYIRENTYGHFTASAFIINSSFDKVLLAHHKKLGKWLQLGGHADGEEDLRKVALTEAQEESGLKHFMFWSPNRISPDLNSFIFDIDVHEIPAYKKDPPHLHFDLRFLLIADDQEKLLCSDESNELSWFSLNSAQQTCEEKSMQRAFLKINWLSTTQNNLYPAKSFKKQTLTTDPL